MPLYEYECQACGHQLEVQQRMADAPLTTCPKCKKRKLEKLISATAFHLKGGGWYKDLYSSTKPGADAKSESADGAGDAGTAEKADKPAAAETTATDKGTKKGGGSGSGGSNGAGGSSTPTGKGKSKKGSQGARPAL